VQELAELRALSQSF